MTLVKKKEDPAHLGPQGGNQMKMTKLKVMREKTSLSQSQLAKLTGIHYRTLQYYEQGVMDFDRARIDKILSAALALNCRLEDLIEDQTIIDKIHQYQNIIKTQ